MSQSKRHTGSIKWSTAEYILCLPVIYICVLCLNNNFYLCILVRHIGNLYPTSLSVICVIRIFYLQVVQVYHIPLCPPYTSLVLIFKIVYRRTIYSLGSFT